MQPASLAPSRRQFLCSAMAAGAMAGLNELCVMATEEKPRPPRFVGIHIAAHSLYDEGFDHCLDLLQETAAVNTLLVTSNSYYGAMLRPKEAQADHGVPRREGQGRRVTKIWFKPHKVYYKDTSLRHAPPEADAEYAGREVFADLAEPARKRGLKVHERLYEPSFKTIRHITHWDKVLTVDVDGKPGDKPCWNHPEYLAFVAASITDLFKSYPLDGIQYGAERNGPLSRLLDWPAALPTCFCEFCKQRARREHVDFDRAKQGLAATHWFIAGLLKGDDPGPDGATVGFLRLLFEYPEILLWEKMHYRMCEELHKLVRDAAKAANPKAFVGRHIDHSQTSWDFLFRAALPYAKMAEVSEYLKLSTYQDILGPRLKGIVSNRYGKHILRGLQPEQILALHYAVAGHDPQVEPKFEAMDATGFSPEYVYRETKRAVEGVAGKAAIFAGIAPDVPKGSGWGSVPWPTDPEKTYRGALRAYDAGASGIVVCREYEENRIESLKAVGRAVRERTAG